MSLEAYKKSMEIESFLRRVLKVKVGTRAQNDLKGCYESIVHYDEGNGLITPSQHKKQVQRLLKYFEKAMDVLAKKNVAKQMLVDQLKMRMQYMHNASDIWYLYDKMRNLEG